MNDARNDESFYCIRDAEVANWMDETRDQVLEVFSAVCREAGVDGPSPVGHRPRFW